MKIRDIETLSLKKMTKQNREIMMKAIDHLLSAQSIKSLKINLCEIDASIAKKIASIFKKNISLKILDLSKSTFVHDALKIIAARLPESDIHTLNLSQCFLNENDIRIVASLIQHNTVPTLKNINLFGNKIDDNGAVMLANSLRTNQCLKKLNLAGNQIARHNKDGIDAFAIALNENQVLQTLDLSGNLINEQDLVEFEAGKIKNTSLKRLSLHYNFFAPRPQELNSSSLSQCNDNEEVTVEENDSTDESFSSTSDFVM